MEQASLGRALSQPLRGGVLRQVSVTLGYGADDETHNVSPKKIDLSLRAKGEREAERCRAVNHGLKAGL